MAYYRVELVDHLMGGARVTAYNPKATSTRGKGIKRRVIMFDSLMAYSLALVDYPAEPTELQSKEGLRLRKERLRESRKVKPAEAGKTKDKTAPKRVEERSSGDSDLICMSFPKEQLDAINAFRAEHQKRCDEHGVPMSLTVPDATRMLVRLGLNKHAEVMAKQKAS